MGDFNEFSQLPRGWANVVTLLSDVRSREASTAFLMSFARNVIRKNVMPSLGLTGSDLKGYRVKARIVASRITAHHRGDMPSCARHDAPPHEIVDRPVQGQHQGAGSPTLQYRTGPPGHKTAPPSGGVGLGFLSSSGLT